MTTTVYNHTNTYKTTEQADYAVAYFSSFGFTVTRTGPLSVRLQSVEVS